VTAAEHLLAHPEIAHGAVRIAFTPDEEIGRGANHFDVARFGCVCAYTLDGGSRGELEFESFSADLMTLTFHGFNTHPGYAKGKMINAIKIAADFVHRLPHDAVAPEVTDAHEGFVHPYAQLSGVDRTVVKLIIRDFDTSGLDTYPQVVAYAQDAIRRCGLQVVTRAIRGGTDGSRLSFMGLPTPNLFAGEHNFHSRLEWVSRQDMEMAVDTIVALCRVWEERAAL
jgi:tripeptide aminopeptidase